MSGRKANLGMTLVETIVVSLILLVLIAILIPALGAARRTARGMQNNTQVCGIHQSFVTFAQGNGGFFAGMDANGKAIHPDGAGRIQLLLEGNYFTGEYVIEPIEESFTAWTTGTLMPNQFSYALLDISQVGQRQAEWRDTINTNAPTLSARNTGKDTGSNIQSVWTTQPGDWRGSVAWNDNHTTFEVTPEMEETQYGEAPTNFDDHLFTTDPTRNDGGDDALMVYP